MPFIPVINTLFRDIRFDLYRVNHKTFVTVYMLLGIFRVGIVRVRATNY